MRVFFLLCCSLIGISAYAGVAGVPVENGSIADKTKLESAVRLKVPLAQEVQCEHVIRVRTGGSLGFAIAGICQADGSLYTLSCLNGMLGGPAELEDKELGGDLTDEYQMLRWIDAACTGG